MPAEKQLSTGSNHDTVLLPLSIAFPHSPRSRRAPCPTLATPSPAPSSTLPLSRLRAILIVSLFTLVHFAFPLTSSSHAIPSPHRSPISAHFYYLHSSSAPHPSLRTAIQPPTSLTPPLSCSSLPPARGLPLLGHHVPFLIHDPLQGCCSYLLSSLSRHNAMFSSPTTCAPSYVYA